ncbi:MAG: FG-GAP-like repeat-containing protein [bacterium]
MRSRSIFSSVFFLGFIGVFLGMNIEASDYAKWAEYKYPQLAAVLKMGVGDIDGDGVKETVALSMEGPSVEFERRGNDGRLQGDQLDGMQGIKVFPNPYMPKWGHQMVTFAFPGIGTVTGSITVKICNGSGIAVRTMKTAGGYQLLWDGRNDSGEAVSAGIYSFTITKEGQSEICGKLLVGIDHVPDTSMRVKVLKLAEPGVGEVMGEVMGEVVVDGSLAGLNTCLQVQDIDNDGKDEIIFGLGNVPEDASNPFPDKASIYVYGWGENGLVQEYKSPEIICGKGIISALTVGDTDGNGRKEILVGITRGNKNNLKATGDNFELLESYISDKKYLAAANLLSAGLLKRILV